MNAGAMNPVKKEVAIHIGECHVSREPTVIRTLLGSCVAVCVFDPVTQVGGMNHILLPGQADLQHYDAPTRYALNAMDLLINDIMKLGGKRYNLTAKVFGGGHIIPCISEEFGMGQKNISNRSGSKGSRPVKWNYSVRRYENKGTRSGDQEIDLSRAPGS